MSLINFLHPKLKPSVESCAVCEDGYTVANLIADDEEQFSRGFMGYVVSKPPVEIIFDFPKAIDLKVIKLWNSYCSLRSSAFEIHGKNDGGIWERVASVRDLDKGVDSVTFCYQSDYSSRSADNSTAQKKTEKSFFYKTAFKMLSNTKSIKIVIRATQNCAPVLRKAQVWGLPARSLEKADRELVKTIWNEITNPYGDIGSDQQDVRRSPSRSIPELNDQSNLQIPEEFLDAITWELMVFPTVLPSGKVVDQSTIDRHSEEECKWGRIPSDPFTGLEFTFHRKAILNLPLKSRIEKFLLENSEHFKTVPRSLGSSRVRRSKNRHVSQFAQLSQSQTQNHGGTYSRLTKSSGYKRTSATETLSSSSATTAKRARHSKDYDNENFETTSSTTTYRTDVATPLASSSYTQPRVARIDQALEQALRKITRFTRPPAATEPANCIRCKSDQYNYEIQTCKHLVCRTCLVHLTRDERCVCKTSFRTTDVERYHKL